MNLGAHIKTLTALGRSDHGYGALVGVCAEMLSVGCLGIGVIGSMLGIIGSYLLPG